MAIMPLTLDVTKPSGQLMQIHGRQGESEIVLRVTIRDDGAPYDFTGKHIEFDCVRPDGNWVQVAEGISKVEDGTNCTFDCKLPVAATASSGVVKLCYFAVRKDDDPSYYEFTERFILNLDPSATFDADLGPYSDKIDDALQDVTNYLDRWDAQIGQQKSDFESKMAEFLLQFTQAQSERDEAFKAAEAERKSTFEAGEAGRNDAEAAREQKSAEAVEAAGKATQSANDAAKKASDAAAEAASAAGEASTAAQSATEAAQSAAQAAESAQAANDAMTKAEAERAAAELRREEQEAARESASAEAVGNADAAAAEATEAAGEAREAARSAAEAKDAMQAAADAGDFDGATFTPSVDEGTGVLSWTNDKGREDPPDVNIKGPKGDVGEGLSILGVYGDLAALQAAHPAGDRTGDGYMIGTHYYVWDGSQWADCGQLQGERGETGEMGRLANVTATVDDGVGVPGVTATLAGEPGDQSLGFDFVNLKGDKGDPGVVEVATTETAGSVKPDGTTIGIAEDGTVSVKPIPPEEIDALFA